MKTNYKRIKMIITKIWLVICAVSLVTAFSVSQASAKATTKRTAKTTAHKMVKASGKKMAIKRQTRIPAGLAKRLPEKKKIVEVTFVGHINESELEPLDKSARDARKNMHAGTSIQTREKLNLEKRNAPAPGGIEVPQDVTVVDIADTQQTEPEKKSKTTVAMKSKSTKELWIDFKKSANNEMDNY